ncbi:MAG TPA: threonine/serine dehydratase [Actinomycetota bacterium]|nr:threonine/serine dehydratase [Actinomycetota bacterium]
MSDAATPTRDDVASARERIAPYVRRTPVLDVEARTFGADVQLTLKLELLQVTGSFKPRGAFNRMLTAGVGLSGVVAASGGNFGLAVGHAARELGYRAEIFVPSTSPIAKIDKVRATGADVRVIDGYYDDAAEAAAARRDETGAVWMHPYDQSPVVAGQGTIGAELGEQAPGTDTVVVAVGGGGLIGGIATWFSSEATRVIGVEPTASSCLRAALDAGRPVEVPVSGRAADSLGARRVGDIAFEVANAGHVERVVLVDDEAILAAQRAIWRELRLFAEPGGAAALSAVMCGAFVPDAGERVVVLVCGANGDPADVIS